MSSQELEQIRSDLQDLVGPLPLISVSTFLNWGGTQRRGRILSCLPESLEQIQGVVRACQAKGVRIRAAGSTHSWSPLYGDDGDMFLYTTNLHDKDRPSIELLQDPADPEGKKLVRVLTNVTTGQLMEFEVDHGVCLPTNVVLDSVTYGGVVVPCCHGTGRTCKSVSDYVASMRIVDAHGELRTYDAKDGEDMMRAVKANMGLFGIVYDITFKMENMLTVQTTNRFEPVSKVFYDREYIRQVMEKHYAVEIMWFPFNSMTLSGVTEAIFTHGVDCSDWEPKDDDVWMRLVEIPEHAGPAKPYHVYELQGLRDWIQIHVGDAVDGILSRVPSIAPAFLKEQFHTIKDMYNREGPVCQQMPHSVHWRKWISEMKALNLEFIMDSDDGMENFCRASQFVIELVQRRAKEGRFPLTLTMEVRLMEHSNLYLSPMQAGNPDAEERPGSGHSMCIELLSMAGTEGWDELMQEVAQYWMSFPGARTHWCKQWGEIDGIYDHLKQIYRYQIPKFMKQLDESKADPNRIFFNKAFEKLLLPEPTK